MKIFLGGTFDPIHKAHIQLALTVSNQFEHPVSFLPLAGVPNYKAAPLASKEDRLAMLKLITNKYPDRLDIDYSEINQTEYSPTINTLKKMRKLYGNGLPFFFIIGADSLYSLDSWNNYQELFNLTNFIVINRPGYALNQASPQLIMQIQARTQPTFVKIVPSGQIIFINFKPMPISSTEIRTKCAAKQAIDLLVEPEIAQYIYTNNLYKGI